MGRNIKTHNEDYQIWLEDNQLVLDSPWRNVCLNASIFWLLTFVLQERHHLDLYHRNKWDPVTNPGHAAFQAKFSQFCSAVEGATTEDYLKSRIATLFAGTCYKPGAKTKSFLKRRKEIERIRSGEPTNKRATIKSRKYAATEKESSATTKEDSNAPKGSNSNKTAKTPKASNKTKGSKNNTKANYKRKDEKVSSQQPVKVPSILCRQCHNRTFKWSH